MIDKSINERALSVLKALIERYIREGQPIGSKAIAADSKISMGLSPASIRNIMADLEEAGYLRSPHTSAGRVPTEQGYRLFVNSLLTVQPLAASQIKEMQTKLRADSKAATLVETASSMLSQITQLAGVVTLPKREHFTLQQIEFLQLSANRILAVIILNEREIQNRVIYTDRVYSPSELQQAGNYLTQKFAGKDWQEIRQAIFVEMAKDRADMHSILHNANDIIEQAFAREETKNYVLAGESNLLTLAEDAGIGKLRSLFAALNQKRIMLDLFDACLRTDGMQIFIGQESGYDAFDNCSIVTAPYSAEGKVLGVLAVIGPTRMPYDKVIAAVDVTAKLLSSALSE